MENNYQEMKVRRIISLLDTHDFKTLKEELESMHPVDIVDAFEELDKKQRTLVFSGSWPRRRRRKYLRI